MNRSLSFIDADMAKEFHIVETSNVSDHQYNPTAQALLAEVVPSDGMILDCGAGSRSFQDDRLIQVEIAPYDNIDVIAVNQRLPFANEVFDVVFSFDVLEHVSDPFASARELARVLKPGGCLYIDIPFLQGEHGYPHHFFNATRMGLRELFKGLLQVEKHIVPPSGHPIHVVWSILRTYHNSLPSSTRPQFAELKVGEILSKNWTELRDEAIGKDISEAGRWIIASTTQALLSKPGKAPMIDASRLPAFKDKPTLPK
jgi:SAM-dependent methyltransferase